MSERTRITAKTPETKRGNTVSKARKPDLSQHVNSPIDQILHLQKTIGNQAVQRLFESGIIQAKLKIGKPGDIYEQEADRVADQVISMPESKVQRQPLEEEEEEIQAKPIAEQITPLVQRQVEEEEEEEEETLQAKEGSDQTPEVTPDLESRIQSLKGGGQPLPKSDREFFEPRFGQDFSSVRVHTDTQAAETSKALNAQAFTIGRDIMFEYGQYASGTSARKNLLAHELTHVVQQTSTMPESIQLIPTPVKRKELTKENVANIVNIHLIDYREQVKSGVRSWNTPEEPQSAVWFWVSLAGNLVWAATAFVNPMATAVIRAMAMLGSVIGSGTLKMVLANKAKTPDIKPLLIQQVSNFADNIKKNINTYVNSAYAFFRLRDKMTPASGWLDANRKIKRRRQIVWNMMFDGKIALWGSSTAIITNTTKEVKAIWKQFKILFDAVIMNIWKTAPRYKGKRLENEVLKLYYRSIVESGVADRSPAVKISKEWKDFREYKVYKFPPPGKGMTGAKVSVPTGGKAIPIE